VQFGRQRECKPTVATGLRFGGYRDYSHIRRSFNILQAANECRRIALYSPCRVHRRRENENLHSGALLRGASSESLILCHGRTGMPADLLKLAYLGKFGEDPNPHYDPMRISVLTTKPTNHTPRVCCLQRDAANLRICERPPPCLRHALTYFASRAAKIGADGKSRTQLRPFAQLFTLRSVQA